VKDDKFQSLPFDGQHTGRESAGSSTEPAGSMCVFHHYMWLSDIVEVTYRRDW